MEDDQQFCLRWNNHQSTLISVFDTLLEKGIHVDCTLAAEGRTLRAHKVVLSACSPYFESVLGQQFDKHPIIILKDVKFAELRAMMDYMYRGEVNISQDQLGALLKAAESLQIKGLSDSKPPPPTPPTPSPSVKIPNVRTSPCLEPVDQQPTQPLPLQPPTQQQRSREGSASPRRRRKKLRTSLSPASEPPRHPTPPPVVNDNCSEPNSEESAPKAKTAQEDAPDPAPHKTENDTDKEVEPKSEFAYEGNDESAEDLTMDEDMDSDAEPKGGCSIQTGGDGPNQVFPWKFDRSQEDMSITQDGQHDIPGLSLANVTNFEESAADNELENDKKINYGSTALEMAPILSQLHTISATDITTPLTSETDSTILADNVIEESFPRNNNVITKEEQECKSFQKSELDSEGEAYDFDDILLPDESEVFGAAYLGGDGDGDEREIGTVTRVGRRGVASEPSPQFECRHCGKRYRWKSTLRRHESVECGGKPPAHACPYCPYRAKQRGNLGVHIRKHHNAQWGAFADTKLRKIKKENKNVKYE